MSVGNRIVTDRFREAHCVENTHVPEKRAVAKKRARALQGSTALTSGGSPPPANPFSVTVAFYRRDASGPLWKRAASSADGRIAKPCNAGTSEGAEKGRGQPEDSAANEEASFPVKYPSPVITALREDIDPLRACTHACAICRAHAGCMAQTAFLLLLRAASCLKVAAALRPRSPRKKVAAGTPCGFRRRLARPNPDASPAAAHRATPSLTAPPCFTY